MHIESDNNIQNPNKNQSNNQKHNNIFDSTASIKKDKSLHQTKTQIDYNPNSNNQSNLNNKNQRFNINTAEDSRKLTSDHNANTNSDDNEYDDSGYGYNGPESNAINQPFKNNEESFDVVMTGNLLYRYTTNQIELDGFWKISLDSQKESFSYLFQSSVDKVCCLVRKKDIEFDTKNEYDSCTLKDDEYLLNICTANIFEVVLLPNENVFRSLLNFISGDYHGFFIYYEKTIEDQFMLNFSLDDDQVKITGIYFIKCRFR